MNPIYNLGIKKAKTSKGHRQYLVAAIISIGKRVISIGVNRCRSHPAMGNIKHLHAEVDAITRVKDKKRLIGSNIFVIRTNPRGRVGMARPCPICLEFIRRYGIKTISYTDCKGQVQHEEVR